MDLLDITRALASEPRLLILQWLRAPATHFTSRTEHDISEHGVCVALIARRLGVSQPTASRHLSILEHARLTRAIRVAQWTFHQRDESGIEEAKRAIAAL